MEGSSRRGLKCGEVIKESFQKYFKKGVGKGKKCLQGKGVERVSPPLPSPKILIVHYQENPLIGKLTKMKITTDQLHST